MRKFIRDILLFTGLLACLLAIGVLLPMTPRAATSLLSAKIDKDELLQTTDSPRIILVGGSNLSFGIDGKMIQDSLGIRPVNTAIHANLGLPYMLNSVAEFVRPKDIVVVVPEYSHFFRSSDYLSPELLRTILDIKPSDRKFLRKGQYRAFIEELPKYALSKFKVREYFFDDTPTVYSRSAFDEFGDVTLHRSLPSKTVVAQPISSSRIYNDGVVNELVRVADQLDSIGAEVVITFPSFQRSSFNNIREDIAQVQQELISHDLRVVGKPEDFKMSDSLMFDTPYHLTGEGIEIRTRRLIELLRPVVGRRF